MSSSTPLPFEHVATEPVTRELNDFELRTKAHYQQLLGDPSCASTKLPQISWEHVVIESVLGEGGFSFVFEVKLQDTGMDQKKKGTESEDKSYALKCLKAKVIHDTDTLLCNAMDISVEAEILSRLNHPNIIQLEGLSAYKLGSSYISSDGYFILLEIMETTLLDKFRNWRNEESRSTRKQLQSKDAILHRLCTIASPIFSAVEYLHSKQIVVRDLKPENVGFAADGQVRLFDFGLARDVSIVKADDVAGSICYMAPEVLLEQGTYLASDIYSLSMLLWELCTLELPMARFRTLEQVKERVAKGHWRPSLSSAVPFKELRHIIQQGWAPKVQDRPTSSHMHFALRKIWGDSTEHDGITLSGDSWSVEKGSNKSAHSADSQIPSRGNRLFSPLRSLFSGGPKAKKTSCR